MGLFGYPDDIDHDFSFELDTVDYTPSPGLLGGIEDIQGMAGVQRGAGKEFQQAYRQMLDPGSQSYQRMFSELRKNVGDTASATIANTNRELAARGIGKGGISGVLGAVNMNRAGEAIRQGTTNILDMGLNRASQFGSLANTAYGQAGQMYGQAGGLLSGIDARGLQANLFNADARNTYNQYLAMARYNQEIANREAKSAWWDNAFGLAGDIGAAWLTGGASIPFSLMSMAGGGGNTGNTYAFPEAMNIQSMTSPYANTPSNAPLPDLLGLNPPKTQD